MAVELSETSITIQQIVHASRNRVWHAWTDPGELDRWWGPMGERTTTHEIDVEVGGE